MIIIMLVLTLLLDADIHKSKIYEDKAQSGSDRAKIILFTTSMSCECTLKMCGEYVKVLQKFRDLYREEIDFEVIDSYADEKSSNKYQISFVPTIIFLDKENKEVKRIVREEDVEKELNNILQTFLGKIK